MALVYDGRFLVYFRLYFELSITGINRTGKSYARGDIITLDRFEKNAGISIDFNLV